jgi:mevalonate kinase
MATFQLAIPAKIVLFGEYWVLRNCPAIGCALPWKHLINIHSEYGDPAVKIQSKAPVDLNKTAIQLTQYWSDICLDTNVDPVTLSLKHDSEFPWHYGWGGSSALLLSLFWAARLIQSQQKCTAAVLWDDYLNFKSKYDYKGSGIDIYTQLQNSSWVPYKQDQSFEYDTGMENAWHDFCKNYPLIFIPTNQKTSSTHAVKAFEQVSASVGKLNRVTELTLQIQSSIQNNDYDGFDKLVNQVNQITFDAVNTTSSYISFYEKLKNVLKMNGVVKSCGALGGDGFLVWLRDASFINAQDLRDEGFELVHLKTGEK